MEKFLLDNQKEVEIKKTINNMTISEFQKYIFVKNDNSLDETDRLAYQISILTGLSFEELMDLDLDEYKEVRDKALIQFGTDINSEFITTIETPNGLFGIRTNSNGQPNIKLSDTKLIKEKLMFDSTDINEIIFSEKVETFAAILFREVIDSVVVNTLDDESISKRAAILKDNMYMGTIYPYIIKLAKQLS